MPPVPRLSAARAHSHLTLILLLLLPFYHNHRRRPRTAVAMARIRLALWAAAHRRAIRRNRHRVKRKSSVWRGGEAKRSPHRVQARTLYICMYIYMCVCVKALLYAPLISYLILHSRHKSRTLSAHSFLSVCLSVSLSLSLSLCVGYLSLRSLLLVHRNCHVFRIHKNISNSKWQEDCSPALAHAVMREK